MTTSLDTVQRWGGAGRALFGIAVRDLALHSRETARTAAIPDRLLRDPLLRDVVRDDFFESLLADAREQYVLVDQHIRAAHAAIVCDLALRHGWPRWPELLPLIFVSAERAGLLDMMMEWAQRGLEHAEDAATRAECRRAMGRALYDYDRFPEATRWFEEAAADARAAGDAQGEWDVLTSLIACLQYTGDHLRALDVIDRAEALARAGEPSMLPKALSDRGNSELRLGGVDAAREAWTEALAAAEKGNDQLWQSNALGNLATIAITRGDLTEAERLNRRALELSIACGDKYSEQFDRNNLSIVLHALDRDEEAFELARGAIRIARERGDDDAVGIYRGQLRAWLIAAGELNAAQALGADESLANAEDDVVIEDDLVASSTALDDTKPEMPSAIEQLLGQGEADAAESLAQQQVDEAPDDWKRFFTLATVLRFNQRSDQAVAVLERALELHPTSTVTLFNLLNAHQRTGTIDRIADRFREAVEDDPYDALARLALGGIYAFSGRHDEAIRHLRHAERLAPKSSVVRTALGQALVAKGKSLLTAHYDAAWTAFEDAFRTFKALLNEHPDRADHFYFTATAFEEIGMASYEHGYALGGGMTTQDLVVLAHAAIFYDQAARESPPIPDVEARRRVLANAEMLGQPTELTAAAVQLASIGYVHVARDYLNVALEKDENFAEALFVLARVEMEERGDAARADAERLLVRAIELHPDEDRYSNALTGVTRRSPEWIERLRREARERRS